MKKKDYRPLDRYLKTVFALIEGGTDVEAARRRLSEYLEYHGENQLDQELEDFLIELFFDKCARDFSMTRSLVE